MIQKLSKAAFVERGYGQVEPNHLSAQRTAQIYAQLPAAATIDVLEQGQFVKYDYLNGECNFTGAGEWMLVYNEIKLYREEQADCEFAMKRTNYGAYVYSPVGGDNIAEGGQSRYYGESYIDAEGNAQTTGNPANIIAGSDGYERDATSNPFTVGATPGPKMMGEYKMVPRVFKTNIGDIFTTNTVNVAEPKLGDLLAPGADGFLAAAGDDAAMKWQVVKVYTMPDRQKAVKIMRIA